MRLRAGLPLLWRGPTEVQVGTDPRWAVTLSDLSPSATQALCSIRPGSDLSALREAFRIEGVDPDETDAVVAHLRSAHLLVESPPTAESADAVAWSLLSADGNGAAVLARRAQARVRITGLSRCGLVLAGLVAAAGIGTLELDDDAAVSPGDLGLGGLSARDLGSPRSAAAARALHDAVPGVRTTGVRSCSTGSGRGSPTPDLVVLIERGAAEPVRYRRLTDDGVPHLSVVVREASVLIGPLVTPRESACLWCADLHRADLDVRWPVLAAQLVGPTAPAVAEEPVLAALAASLAAAQVLAHVDGRASLVRDASIEVRLPDLEPRRVPRPPHPRCDCAGYLFGEHRTA